MVYVWHIYSLCKLNATHIIKHIPKQTAATVCSRVLVWHILLRALNIISLSVHFRQMNIISLVSSLLLPPEPYQRSTLYRTTNQLMNTCVYPYKALGRRMEAQVQKTAKNVANIVNCSWQLSSMWIVLFSLFLLSMIIILKYFCVTMGSINMVWKVLWNDRTFTYNKRLSWHNG